MFFKSRFIKQLLEENKRKDQLISELTNKIMAKSYGEFATYTPVAIEAAQEEKKRDLDEELIGMVSEYETE